MKRFMIERDIPGVGEFSLTELCGASRASNQALATLGPFIQWQHSYLAGDKTFCVYIAESEDEIGKHAELSGIPVSKITETPQIIDPLKAGAFPTGHCLLDKSLCIRNHQCKSGGLVFAGMMTSSE